MSICEKECNLPTGDNELKVLVCALKREVETLISTTESQLLLQDGKIAECCNYLKDNLSNSIRCLLADMEASGELDRIISETVNTSISILNHKFEHEIDPDEIMALTDYGKLQGAIDKAILYINNFEKCVIKLNRVYDITGYSLKVNKPVNREKLIIEGSKGGIKKLDSGYMFVKGDTSYVTDLELKDINIRGKEGLILFKSPDFINTTINNCKLDTVDTICDSKTYMQNIKLVNSLVTGGNGNLFDGGGFYGLYVMGNTIEHRKGYVVNQSVISGNMYDSCYFIDIVNNLIEGFSSGGIAYLKKISKVNILNNYFENMKNNIVLDCNSNVGILSVDNNRLFIGSSEFNEYSEKGLITIKTNKYPIIHAHSNKVENCYLVALENGFSVTNTINLNSNSVNNSIQNNDFTINDDNKNHEINLFPLTEITGSINKYDRKVNVISDKKYLRKLSIEGGDVRLVVKNGEISSSVSVDKLVSTSVNNYNLYFGIPVFSDDLTDIEVFSQTVNVSNKFRYGGGNDKNLLVIATSTSGSSQTTTFIATLREGSSVRG